MSKRTKPDPAPAAVAPELERGENPLTTEEAADLADALTGHGQGEDDAARILLLAFALTHERDLHKREYMFVAIEARVGPYLRGFTDLRRERMSEQLDALRKGGAR